MSLSDETKPRTFPDPIVPLNEYLWDKLCSIDPNLKTVYKGIMPIFPLSDGYASNNNLGGRPYIVYNMMHRSKLDPFYVLKRDSFIYSLRGNVKMTMEWGSALHIILDRMDDVAKEVNEYNGNHKNHPIRFESLRLYEVDRPDANNSSNAPYIVTNFIVTANYHFTKSLDELINS